jgi:hypothetical protein
MNKQIVLAVHTLDTCPIAEKCKRRELIDTGTDQRYVRRNKRGTSFIESDHVGRSLAAEEGARPLSE